MIWLQFIVIWWLCAVSICVSLLYKGSCGDPVDIKSVCSTIIDYRFFIPPNRTVADLDEIANNYFRRNLFQMFPEMCLSAAKEVFCLSVFVKCPKACNSVNGTLDLQTSVAFGRPSKSVCRHMDSNCFGMCSSDLFNLGFTVDKIPTVRLGPPDPTSLEFSIDRNTCYEMPPPSREPDEATVSVNVESRLDIPSICADFIFPGDVMSSPPFGSLMFNDYDPLRPMFETQASILNKIQDIMSSLPIWLNKQCINALRQYLCTSSILSAVPLDLSSIVSTIDVSTWKNLSNIWKASGVQVDKLVNSTMQLPSFPSRDICMYYEDTCADFISLLRSTDLASTLPHGASKYLLNTPCNATLSPSLGYPPIELYPMTFKVTVNKLCMKYSAPDGQINFFDLPLEAPTKALRVMIPPVHFPAPVPPVDDGIVTCPRGFVIPDDPSDPNIAWVPGTVCAFECKTPILTGAEWRGLESIAMALTSTGVFFGFALLVSWYYDESKRKHHLLMVYLVMSLLEALVMLIARSSDVSTVCKSNAAPITEADGINACTIQSVLGVYFIVACCLCWALITFDIFVKVVRLNFLNYNNIYFGMIVLVPLIPASIFAVYGNPGYSGYQPYCFSTSIKSVRIIVMGLVPMISIGSFCTICTVGRSVWMLRQRDLATVIKSIFFQPDATLYMSIVSKAAVSGENQVEIKQSLQLLRSPLAFMLSFIVVYLVIMSSQVYWSNHSNNIERNLAVWRDCVFANFDIDYSDVCGEHPARLFSYSHLCFFFVCMSGRLLLYCFLFLRFPWQEIIAFMLRFPRILRRAVCKINHTRVGPDGILLSGVGGSHRRGASFASSGPAPESGELEGSMSVNDNSSLKVYPTAANGLTLVPEDGILTSAMLANISFQSVTAVVSNSRRSWSRDDRLREINSRSREQPDSLEAAVVEMIPNYEDSNSRRNSSSRLQRGRMWSEQNSASLQGAGEQGLPINSSYPDAAAEAAALAGALAAELAQASVANESASGSDKARGWNSSMSVLRLGSIGLSFKYPFIVPFPDTPNNGRPSSGRFNSSANRSSGGRMSGVSSLTMSDLDRVEDNRDSGGASESQGSAADFQFPRSVPGNDIIVRPSEMDDYPYAVDSYLSASRYENFGGNMSNLGPTRLFLAQSANDVGGVSHGGIESRPIEEFSPKSSAFSLWRRPKL